MNFVHHNISACLIRAIRNATRFSKLTFKRVGLIQKGQWQTAFIGLGLKVGIITSLAMGLVDSFPSFCQLLLLAFQ